MKAAVYYNVEDLRVEQVADPECGEGEVVIQVGACGVCGSDARIYHRGHPEVEPPKIIGHEIAGTIVATGAGVDSYQVGDRIALTPEVTCGRCSFCLSGRQNMCRSRKALGLYYPGGFAEYMVVPARAVSGGNIVPLPDGVTFEQATLIEPLACCLNALDYLHIGPGDRVVILGAGAMGCMMIALARLSGATQIISINARSAARRALAQRVGADHYISAEESDPVETVRALTGGDGADVVIVAANAVKAAEEAIVMAGVGGRVCFFAGMPAATAALDVNLIHYREVSVYGAFSSRRRHADIALDLIVSGRLDTDVLITHRLPLDEILRGIEMKGTGESIKAVVLP